MFQLIPGAFNKFMSFFLPLVLMLSGTSTEKLDKYSQYLGNDDYTGIAEVYEDYFPVGCAVWSGQLDEEGIQDFIKKNFNSITFEWELKQIAINPRENEWNIGGTQKIIDFAMANGMKLRGHTMMWSVSSTWMAKANGDPDSSEFCTKDVLFERMDAYFKEVFEKFGSVIDDWDIVNEPSYFYPWQTYHPNSDWYKIAGEEYIVKAFELAQKYGNDDDKFYVNEIKVLNNRTKENNLFKTVEMLRSKGLRVDGIGIQCHLDTVSINESQFNLERLLKRAKKENLDVQITEMDMRCYTTNDQEGWPDGIMPEWIKYWQMNKYQRFFEIFREYKDIIKGVTFWGLDDAHSAVTWEGKRADWPLLFDVNGKPKENFFAVCDF